VAELNDERNAMSAPTEPSSGKAVAGRGNAQDAVCAAIWPWKTRRPESAAASPSTCRRRALIQAAVMAVVAGVILLRFPHAAAVVFCVALAVLVAGLFLPRAFGAFERMMHALGRGVGAAMTWLLLAPLFFLVFTPAALVRALRRKDPLCRAFPPEADSSWHPCRETGAQDHYRKQYR
jgi:hypothetical protein